MVPTTSKLKAGPAFGEPSIDDDPDQPISVAPARGFGQRRAQYPSGSLIRRRDTDFDTGCAGAHCGRADAVDRQYRQRYRIRHPDTLAARKAMQQRHPPQTFEAGPTH